MIVKVVDNSAASLPQNIRDYAHPEGDTEGILDVSVGKHYPVYGVMELDGHKWYFVHTDTMNVDSFWWMPSQLYETVDTSTPDGWVLKDNMHSYPVLFEGTVENDIIDREDEAIQRYLSEVGADPTFPSQSQIDDLNKPFEADKKREEYEKAKLLAKERGYEWPAKPLDNE